MLATVKLDDKGVFKLTSMMKQEWSKNYRHYQILEESRRQQLICMGNSTRFAVPEITLYGI